MTSSNIYPDFSSDGKPESAFKSALAFLWELVKVVVISLAIILPIRYFLVQPFFVNGASMEESFHDGDYILIDEIMNGRDYCIVGKAAAHYWKWIEQIPVEYEVYTTKKQGIVDIFHTRLRFRRRRKIPQGVIKTVFGHPYIIATKKERKRWK